MRGALPQGVTCPCAQLRSVVERGDADRGFEVLTKKGATLLALGRKEEAAVLRSEVEARLQSTDILLVEEPNAEFLEACGRRTRRKTEPAVGHRTSNSTFRSRLLFPWVAVTDSV